MQALGTLATMLAFACLRLWFAAPRKIQTEALPTIASNQDSASSRVFLVGRLVAPFHAWLPRTAIRIPQQISWWFFCHSIIHYGAPGILSYCGERSLQ